MRPPKKAPKVPPPMTRRDHERARAVQREADQRLALHSAREGFPVMVDRKALGEDPAVGLDTEPSIIATRTMVKNEEFLTIQFYNGHRIYLNVMDGWLYIKADSTLTVRPVNDHTIYVRPVGYVGAWVPDFAAKPSLLSEKGGRRR